MSGTTQAHRSPHAGQQRRVREQVRDGVAVMVFSLTASVGVAVLLTLLVGEH